MTDSSEWSLGSSINSQYYGFPMPASTIFGYRASFFRKSETDGQTDRDRGSFKSVEH